MFTLFGQDSEIPLIVSGTVDGKKLNSSSTFHSTTGIDEICELQLPFEKADMRLIPHIQWDVIHFLQSSVTEFLMILMYLCFSTSKNSVENDYENCI